ncbi:hypothetical protein ACVWZ3_003656 [Bradyrhizobium sp. i1.3.6]
MRLVRLLVAPVAGELMPGQSQLDQSLPVGAVGGRRGPLHRRLGFVLWVVLGAHEAEPLTDRYGRTDGNFVRMNAGWLRVVRTHPDASVKCVTACNRRLG